MVKVLQWKIANWNYSPRMQCKDKEKRKKKENKAFGSVWGVEKYDSIY